MVSPSGAAGAPSATSASPLLAPSGALGAPVVLVSPSEASGALSVAAGLYRESPIAQQLPWQWALEFVFLFLCLVLLVSHSEAAGASEAPAGAAGLYRESPIAQLLHLQWAQAAWAAPKPGEVAGQVLLLQAVQPPPLEEVLPVLL